MPPNELKKRIASGEKLYGAWLAMAHTGCAELMAHAGFDFLILRENHPAMMTL